MTRLIIGIAGGSGSGKSTVARKVAESLSEASVAFIDMDAYYRNFTQLPMEERRRVNWDHPDAFDLELLAEHLDRLAAGEAIDKPVYDFVSHTRSERVERIAPADVVVIDGILLFVDEAVRARCDVKVFVDADADIRLIRRMSASASTNTLTSQRARTASSTKSRIPSITTTSAGAILSTRSDRVWLTKSYTGLSIASPAASRSRCSASSSRSNASG